MTTADKYAALLAEVLAHRDDDAPRLILADWLEDASESRELADGARADLIRVQLELATLEPEPDPTTEEDEVCLVCGEFTSGTSHYHCLRCREQTSMMGCGNPECVEKDRRETALQRRETELLDRFATSRGIWCPDPLWGLWMGGTALYDYRRGFIESVRLSPTDWLRHADSLLACCPLREVTLTTHLRVDHDWGFVDSDCCIAWLYGRDGPSGHDEWRVMLDLQDIPQGAHIPTALLEKAWPGIEFDVPHAEDLYEQ